jgi:apolipoprotein D and lipocalin family protein
MKHLFWGAAALLMVSCAAARETLPPLATVAQVDIQRYMGTWYEIAKFPQRFEKGLVGVTATYTLLPDGRVRVINSGYKNTFEGKLKTAKGIAWVVDKTTNAKLKVRFFWPFAGNYWILELGTDYEYVVVGDQSRKYLWILSREPRMDDAVYKDIVARLALKGFDITLLEMNPQKPTVFLRN